MPTSITIGTGKEYLTAQLAWDALSGADQGGTVTADCTGAVGTTFSASGTGVNPWVFQTEGVLYDGSNDSALASIGRVNIQSDNVILRHIKVTNNNNFDNAIDILGANSFGEDIYIEDTSTSSTSYGAAQVRGTALNKGLRRFVVNATCAQLVRTGFDHPCELTNGVGFGATSRGIVASGQNQLLTDVLFFDCNANAFSGTFELESNTASDDATAAHTPYGSAELVNFIGNDYRTKSTSFLATAGSPFVGAYLETAASEIITADPGVYSLTGTDTTLTAQRRTQADTGSYALTGEAVQLNAQRATQAGAGSYALTGTAAALTASYRLTAGTGSYTLTGEAVQLNAQRTTQIDAGTYTLTGADVNFPAGGALVAEPGVYASTGGIVGLIASRRTAADAGNYTLTGEAVQLNAQRTTQIDAGSYALTGTAVDFFANYVIVAEQDAYILTGASVSLVSSGDVTQVVSKITAQFKAVEVFPAYSESWTVKFKEE